MFTLDRATNTFGEYQEKNINAVGRCDRILHS